MTNQQLKNKIMRRVYAAWFWNKSKPVLFLQLPLMIVFLAIQHEYVAFKAVAANTFDSLSSPSSVFPRWKSRSALNWLPRCARVA